MKPVTVSYNGYLITSDKSLLSAEAAHNWLSKESYWAKNIPYEVVKRSFENSYCIGILKNGQQVGFARMITDYATFAYLADVYVEDGHRGQGLGKKMMEIVMEQDWVKRLRRIMLATLDAHGMYSQFGFVQPAIPERFMEINRPVIYEGLQEATN